MSARWSASGKAEGTVSPVRTILSSDGAIFRGLSIRISAAASHRLAACGSF